MLKMGAAPIWDLAISVTLTLKLTQTPTVNAEAYIAYIIMHQSLTLTLNSTLTVNGP